MRTRYLGSLLVVVLSCMVAGCTINVASHDEDAAALEASRVLNLIYFKKDFQGALDRCPGLTDKVKPDVIQATVDQMENQWGKLKSLVVDSFQPSNGGEKSITVFATGQNEKGPTYHRIFLLGDQPSGYKVNGFWFKSTPYDAPNKRPLKKPLPVQ